MRIYDHHNKDDRNRLQNGSAMQLALAVSWAFCFRKQQLWKAGPAGTDGRLLKLSRVGNFAFANAGQVKSHISMQLLALLYYCLNNSYSRYNTQYVLYGVGCLGDHAAETH